MKKILDFIIIFLLVFLILNLFQDKPKPLNIPSSVVVSMSNSSYTIPANVSVDIQNNTNKEISINTCDDFKLNNVGEYLSLPDSFCKDIKVKPLETKKIDYSEVYNLFQNVGNYRFETEITGKILEIPFTIENKGTISKIFVWLFYAPAYNIMVLLLQLFGGGLGLAIIAITIFIRLLLVWPQHKMMLSQRKLQKIQPKIKEIQEKYKGQNQILGVKMMELYKKEKVNPMGSCGFLLIQMPILMVIYNIILHIKDPSNSYYIYQIPYLQEFNVGLINHSFLGMDLLATGGVSGVILGVSVGLIQFIQVKLSLKYNQKDKSKGVVLEKKKGASDYSSMMPDPEMMNKFMLYGMPGMIAIFTYNFPAGLGLYWGLSTLFMIIQQLIVNRKIK